MADDMDLPEDLRRELMAAAIASEPEIRITEETLRELALYDAKTKGTQ
jgi:hypothetical protein